MLQWGFLYSKSPIYILPLEEWGGGIVAVYTWASDPSPFLSAFTWGLYTSILCMYNVLHRTHAWIVSVCVFRVGWNVYLRLGFFAPSSYLPVRTYRGDFKKSNMLYQYIKIELTSHIRRHQTYNSKIRRSYCLNLSLLAAVE